MKNDINKEEIFPLDIDGNYDISTYSTKVYVDGADLYLIGKASKFNQKTTEELNKKIFDS